MSSRHDLALACQKLKYYKLILSIIFILLVLSRYFTVYRNYIALFVIWYLKQIYIFILTGCISKSNWIIKRLERKRNPAGSTDSPGMSRNLTANIQKIVYISQQKKLTYLLIQFILLSFLLSCNCCNICFLFSAPLPHVIL